MTRLATFQACDEIANAGLGKLAFIGLYSGEMIIPEVPFTLPQFFFIVRFRTPIDDRPTKLAIRIERPGQEPFRIDNTSLLLQGTPPISEDARFYQIQTIARIAPFEITEPGTVRVFVEDEIGDNYAGGMRIRVGVHPQAALPRLAETANLVAAHYDRKSLSDISENLRQELGARLMEAFSATLRHNQIPIGLSFPDLDVRLVLDDKRIRVFLPTPIDPTATEVVVASGGNFDTADVESLDAFGFVVRFEPSAPADAVFAFDLFDKPKVERKAAKRKPKK
ncbi:hypothetical protein HAP47_0020640 [Bradyrhizobium sp. 41S5]|uniref:DUF6941 family protein n=1 Tax=Bradyrhizobium sp. 41S5 TaxID=1404443 RepID=UPI00156BD910|nr:hypothetical protein [Bradyrhizobium sp. 41S5]UFX41722.1 hypothetical protein HAP47_0020640 [Bradyrhizobium sp. 41S5]